MDLLLWIGLFSVVVGVLVLTEALAGDSLAGGWSELWAKFLWDRGLVHHLKGRHSKAERCLQRALQIREKVLGPDHPDTAESLHSLGLHYRAVGQYAKAESLYQRALRIREKTLGSQHLDTAVSLNCLASLYRTMGDYTKAEPLGKRALEIWETTLGPEHPKTAAGLCGLADFYLCTGNYAKAEPLYQRAFRIWEKALGPNHRDTGAVLHRLARLYRGTGEYTKAEPLSQRALHISRKALGSHHPDVASVLGDLGLLNSDMGDLAKAESLYQQALRIVENALGPEHPATADSLNNLARLYCTIKDYAKAEPLIKRALQIQQTLLGSEHPETAESLINLAELCLALGDCARAEPLLQRALAIHEKVLGLEHPRTGVSVGRLGWLYSREGVYAKAEPLMERALAIHEKTLGGENIHTGASLANLASLYRKTGNFAKAELFFRRALQIFNRVVGAKNLDTNTAMSQVELGCVLVDLGRASEALPLVRQSHQVTVSLWSNLLSFTSESQRLAFQAGQHPCDLFATLGSAPDLALAVLQFKGVVLDSLLEDRLVAQASDYPETRALVDQLRSLKHRLTQLIFEAPKDLSEQAQERREEEKKRLTQEAEQLESTLARHVAGLGRTRRSLSVTVEEVQAAIPKEAVLLEWLRYEQYLGKNQFEKRCGVIVLASSGEPKWFSLGRAEAIEKNIEQYRQSVGRASQPAGSGGISAPSEDISNPESEIENGTSGKMPLEPAGKDARPTFSDLLHTLYQQLWAPIESLLPPGTKTVILSPDSALNFLSFATLLTPDDQFLSQKYSIRYVASGRDLLREFQSPSTESVTIFSNPDFSGPSSTRTQTPPGEPGTLRSLERRDFENLQLPALPGTAQESAALEAKARKWNWPVEVFQQAEATKSRLQEIRSARILHLATHGFFLSDAMEHPLDETVRRRIGETATARGVGGVRPFEPIEFGGEAANFLRPGRVLKNPMHRSGLALAGAQATLDAWRRGESASARDDGIVTAAEVGTLKLEGTELVVLSACETGVGEAKSGEGVLGLRRGFIQAGAQNLLMTLWSVADEETAQIMAEFYERFHSSGNAPQALAEVQRDWLVRLRNKRGLLEAVMLAGPFILSSQGQLGD